MRAILGTCLFMSTVLVGACTPDRSTVEPSAPPASQARQDAVFVRTCDSSVSGDLGHGWRKDSVVAGPVAFVSAHGYEDDPKRWFRAAPGRARAQKVLLVVDGERPVLVSVPDRDAALFYNPARWGLSNRVAFGRGDEATRFEPCTDDDQASTQFNGGFLVRRPSCVRVTVRVDGENPIDALLSFGMGECAT
jgi:hypothetical protein